MKEDGSIGREKATIMPARAFSFNPEKFEFNVGNSTTSKIVKLSEVQDIYGVDRSTYQLSEEIKSNNGSGMLLMSTACDLVETPMLRKRLMSLSESEIKTLCKKTESVIKDVYYKVAIFGGEPIRKSARVKTGSVCSFSAAVFGNGTFRLTTLGDYSALATGGDIRVGSVFYGPDVSQEQAWEDPSLPIEYQLHNADRDNAEAKRLSLYAGAGAIAWFANLFRK